MNVILKMAIMQKAGNQTVFAREIKIGESTLSRIVNGWKIPTPEQKEVIARALGISASDLFPEGR